MREYRHLLFTKNWDLTPPTWTDIGICEGIIRSITRTPILPDHYQRLFRLSLNKGAQSTTAIEGNTLSDEEIERVAKGGTVAASKQYQATEVQNILAAFDYILKDVVKENHTEFISDVLLKRYHAMIGRDLGTHFDAIPGQFRNDLRIVGPYRTPDSQDIPELVDRLCGWLRHEFHYPSQTFADAIVQAIITHVYIEWIHPFGDGNGRTGRLVEFYLLLRAGTPDIAAHILSNYYNETRPEYYRQLQQANNKRDLTDFIAYAIRGFRDGLYEVLDKVQQSQLHITWLKLIYDKFAEKKYNKKSVFIRQRQLALDFPIGITVPVEQVPLLSLKLARQYAVLSNRTVLRDLEVLEELELVKKTADGYQTTIEQLRQHFARSRDISRIHNS